jgi:hypothetical protein
MAGTATHLQRRLLMLVDVGCYWVCGVYPICTEQLRRVSAMQRLRAGVYQAADAVGGYSTDRRMVSMRMSMRW